MTEQEEFAGEVEELLARRIKAFAGYVESQWKIDTSDEKGLREVGLTAEQAEGWNRCCDSLAGAASMWLEEYP